MHWNSFALPMLLLGALASGASPAVAQEYPVRPVRMIVPYPPGGSTDVLARIYATKMGERLGQRVVTENRGGAGTIIGTRAVAESSPDGYSLLFTTSAILAAPYTYKDAGYKVEDFKLVNGVGIYSLAMWVNTKVPAKTLQEFVEYAKTRDMNYSSHGKASSGTLMITRFMDSAKIKMVEVVYSGTGPSHADLTAGTIQANITSASATLYDPARVRALAVTSTQRLPFLPDVPTFTESGYPEMIGGVWFAVFVPARTPETIVQRLADVVSRTNAEKDVQEKRNAMGLSPFSGDRDAVQDFIRKDFELTFKDFQRLNLKPE